MEASFTRTPGVPCNEPSWIPVGTIRKVWHSMEAFHLDFMGCLAMNLWMSLETIRNHWHSMEASFTWTSGVPCNEPLDVLRNQ